MGVLFNSIYPTVNIDNPVNSPQLSPRPKAEVL